MTALLNQGTAEERLEAAVLNVAQMVNANWPEIEAALMRAGEVERLGDLASALEVWHATIRDVFQTVRVTNQPRYQV